MFVNSTTFFSSDKSTLKPPSNSGRKLSAKAEYLESFQRRKVFISGLSRAVIRIKIPAIPPHRSTALPNSATQPSQTSCAIIPRHQDQMSKAY